MGLIRIPTSAPVRLYAVKCGDGGRDVQCFKCRKVQTDLDMKLPVKTEHVPAVQVQAPRSSELFSKTVGHIKSISPAPGIPAAQLPPGKPGGALKNLHIW